MFSWLFFKNRFVYALIVMLTSMVETGGVWAMEEESFDVQPCSSVIHPMEVDFEDDPQALLGRGKDFLNQGESKEAYACFENASKRGVFLATCYCAAMCDTGKGVPEDKPKAMELLTKAYSQGGPNLLYSMGIECCEAQNSLAALEWFKRAKIKHHPEAHQRMGEIFYERGFGFFLIKKYKEALKQFQKAKKNGSLVRDLILAETRFWVGYEYLLEKDYVNAYRFYKEAAVLGHPEAQFYLAIKHYEKQKYSKFLKWCREAAENDQIDAQYHLGISYLGLLDLGGSLPFDETEALEWLRCAKKKKHPEATKYVAEVRYNIGVGFNMNQDYGKAFEYFQKAAYAGHSKAQFNLGVMYRRGEGVPKSDVDALKWFVYAAAQGHVRALEAVSDYTREM
ncbi:MAG: hypothetical protein BGO67_01820 [Alphaproteobacteria bacterium 41-28]|nr:MAG: hypothetical protein BGO67_01820 [Alphaproteobacteria bacterium 41-28]